MPSRSPSITVEFHAVNYRTRPGGMLYRYRMVGVDMTWKQTREPYATYTGLPVGEYTFEVEAIDLDLTRSESPATVDIEVFYEPMSSVVNIRDVQLDDIFPSLRHAYAYQPLGSVRVINDDSSPVEATVGLYIPAAMDRPVERTITLAPHSNQVLPLEVTLSDDVLERQGSAPVQAEVSLSCEIGEKVISVRQSHTVTLHGRGALTWDETAKAAAFVTPDDPQVAAFARGLLAAHRAQLPRRPQLRLLGGSRSGPGVHHTRPGGRPREALPGGKQPLLCRASSRGRRTIRHARSATHRRRSTDSSTPSVTSSSSGLPADVIDEITDAFEAVWSVRGGGHHGAPHDDERRSCIVPFIDQHPRAVPPPRRRAHPSKAFCAAYSATTSTTPAPTATTTPATPLTRELCDDVGKWSVRGSQITAYINDNFPRRSLKPTAVGPLPRILRCSALPASRSPIASVEALGPTHHVSAE